jgi:tight adherence protein B
MSETDVTALLAPLAVVCLATSLGLLGHGIAGGPDTPLGRLYFRYVSSLDRRMGAMFIASKGAHVFAAQCGAIVVALLAALLLQSPGALFACPAIAFAPGVVLEHMRKRRVAAIEAKLDGFVTALANALRATPSPGRALAMVQPVTHAPLDREIELVLREMRLGSTLEQALGNMSARVRSFHLDAALSGILIGRQTGGNVPQILDQAAETLREMTRLSGMLRAKTAEGRAQANVLAFLPAAILFAFDAASPGYFRPLTESSAGVMVTVVALCMWFGSVVMTRHILEVEL